MTTYRLHAQGVARSGDVRLAVRSSRAGKLVVVIRSLIRIVVVLAVAVPQCRLY